MLDILFVTLAIAGALIASVTDLKSRIVPNKLSFSLLATGIIGNTAYGFYSGDTSLIGDLAKGVFFIFAVGYVFWVLGGWSAGDAKEFLFIASLLPRYPPSLLGYLNPRLASYLFPVTILVNTFILILPVLIMYSIAVSYKKLSLKEFFHPLLNLRKYIREALFVVSALSLSIMLGKPYLFLIALLAFHVPWLTESRSSLLSLLVIIIFISANDPVARLVNLIRYFVTIVAFFTAMGLFWNSLSIIRRKALQETRRISDLREGDVIAEEIYIQDGQIKKDSRSFSERFRALVRSKEEREARKNRTLIASPKAAGLSASEIATLKDYVAGGVLEDKMTVKKSMPFAPVTLLGLLSALLVGDIVVLLR
jgi:preflagellin peptidase FlaK